jgi:hypothetical protein
MLIQTAEKEKKRKLAAMLIQDSCRDFLEAKRRDRAARVIQRFFLYVKHEVDRMIRATRRQRKMKKKLKNRNERMEDDMLEDAWMTAVSQSNLENEPLHRNLSIPVVSIDWQDESFGNNEPLARSRSRSTEKTASLKQRPRSRSGSRRGDGEQHHNTDNTKNAPKKKHRLPPGYTDRPTSGHTDKPSTIVRLHNDDDDHSEFSGLTASTAANAFRMPPSRMRKLDSREIEEDLELEEAFIDAQIYSAKARRMADKRGLQKQRSSSPAPSSSRRSHDGTKAKPSSKGSRRRPSARVKVTTMDS